MRREEKAEFSYTTQTFLRSSNALSCSLISTLLREATDRTHGGKFIWKKWWKNKDFLFSSIIVWSAKTYFYLGFTTKCFWNYKKLKKEGDLGWWTTKNGIQFYANFKLKSFGIHKFYWRSEQNNFLCSSSIFAHGTHKNVLMNAISNWEITVN